MPGDSSAELFGRVLQLRAGTARAVRDFAFRAAAAWASEARQTCELALDEWPRDAPQRTPLILATEATKSDYRLAAELDQLPASVSMQRVGQLSSAIRNWTDAALSIEHGAYDRAVELTGHAAAELPDEHDDIGLALGESVRLSRDLAVILLGGTVDMRTRDLDLLAVIGPADADRVTVLAAMDDCPHGKKSYDGSCMARPPCPRLS